MSCAFERVFYTTVKFSYNILRYVGAKFVNSLLFKFQNYMQCDLLIWSLNMLLLLLYAIFPIFLGNIIIIIILNYKFSKQSNIQTFINSANKVQLSQAFSILSKSFCIFWKVNWFPMSNVTFLLSNTQKNQSHRTWKLHNKWGLSSSKNARKKNSIPLLLRHLEI